MAELRRRALGPLLALGAEVCLVLVLELGSGHPLRVAAGLLLVLLLPGAAILVAARPPGRPSLDAFAVAVALSIATTLAATVALHAFDVELDARSWGYAIGAVAAVAGAVGALRAPRELEPRPQRAPLRRLQVLAVAGAVACLAGAAAVTADSVRREAEANHFTQLWVVPDRALGGVAVGVRNEEGEPQRYVVQIGVGARNLRTLPITVADGATWTTRRAVPGGVGKVRVSLRRGTDPGAPPYRRVEVELR